MKKAIRKWLGLDKIDAKLHNLNGDVLTIQEKQLAAAGFNPHQDMQAIAQDGATVMMNLGSHEWVCKDCGVPIQDCKAAKPQCLN